MTSGLLEAIQRQCQVYASAKHPRRPCRRMKTGGCDAATLSALNSPWCLRAWPEHLVYMSRDLSAEERSESDHESEEEEDEVERQAEAQPVSCSILHVPRIIISCKQLAHIFLALDAGYPSWQAPTNRKKGRGQGRRTPPAPGSVLLGECSRANRRRVRTPGC